MPGQYRCYFPMEVARGKLAVNLSCDLFQPSLLLKLHTVQVKIKFFVNPRSTLSSVIMEGTLEPCHLHLVLSTCLIALVVVAVNITKSKNVIVRHVDNTK